MASKKQRKRKKARARLASEPRRRTRAAAAPARAAAQRDYIAAHAKAEGVSRFDPQLRLRPDGTQRVTRAEYVAAYRKAWVEGDQRWGKVRKTGSPALRRYLVDVTNSMESWEYDGAYGTPSPGKQT